ncbi:hypothetical protein LEP1GSC073_3937 [Leptospira noguchii str. Cascata]|nr:hypothetical protein LEP1GSC072_0315 [Leptospira noguchii str. Bonito]EMS86892.1 hypothetical protein LEP1GSC073_3937 [Leptospira noguchii str. Cascata]
MGITILRIHFENVGTTMKIEQLWNCSKIRKLCDLIFVGTTAVY